MSGGERVVGFGEHVRHRKKKDNEWARKVRVKTCIEVGNQAIAEGNFYRAACIARDKLMPVLLAGKSIRMYDAAIDDNGWDAASLTRFTRKADEYTRVLRDGNRASAAQELAWEANGFQSAYEAAVQTTVGAFASLEAIAAHEELITGELRNHVNAVGYTLKIGKMWKSPTRNIGDPVRVISRDSGLTKTLFHGGTGQGKSSALGTEVEDRYNSNHRQYDSGYYRQNGMHRKSAEQLAQGMKILDIFDFREGENMMYDVPQQDPELRRIREDHDMPATFEESDELLTPQVEILVPLTRELADSQLPYNTDNDEFSVTPFTIPASTLSKPLLVSLMASMVTGQQETTLRTAYDDVARQHDDWTLKDLAEEVMRRDDLGKSYQKRVAKLLANVQNVGFIRDHDCPYALDYDKWMEIFRDTDTITVFSQAFMEQMEHKLMVAGYLLDSVDSIREDEDLPDLALPMRELHKVAAHREETSFDDQEEALQEVIANRLSLLSRENRHVGVEIIADTQDVLHLKKGFRKQFNRFVTFNTSNESLKVLFKYTSSSRWKSCADSLTKKKGEAAVIGQAEPLINRDDLDYLAHVQYIPPSWHVLDTDTEPSGEVARCRYLEHEELRDADFDGVEVPDKLLIDNRVIDNDMAARTSMEKFIDQCLVVTDDKNDYEHTSDVRRSYHAWAHDRNEEQIANAVSFGKRINKYIDNLEKKYRDGGEAYVGIRFTPRGQDYAKVKTQSP